MWYDYKKHVAPIYQDETYRRMFATASGRRPRRKKQDEDRDEETRGSFASRWMRRLTRRRGDSEGPQPLA